MIFEEGSITNRHGEVEAYNNYSDFGYWSIQYRVEHSETDDGSYNTEEHILTVTPEQFHEDHTILHEMIHVYENQGCCLRPLIKYISTHGDSNNNQYCPLNANTIALAFAFLDHFSYVHSQQNFVVHRYLLVSGWRIDLK